MLSLHDEVSVDHSLRFSMANDVIKGMQYLHSHSVVHGQLRSTGCFIDSDWSVKVGDWSVYIKRTVCGVLCSKSFS